MSLGIECKKLKRTGYIPLFLMGGLLAAAVPIIMMTLRAEIYTGQPGNPLHILLDANWQMMAMLNVLLAVCGACLMYHTEYADNASQRMDMLPVRQGSLFLGKFLVAVLASSGAMMLESISVAICLIHWFPEFDFSLMALINNMGFEMALMLPTIMLMLLIASACKNMWVSLGIGVILVFTFSILPSDHRILTLCPFATPYQLLHTAQKNGRVSVFLLTSGIETLGFGAGELMYQKVRRCFV